MDQKSIIENIVESIKGYFSITGLIVIGVYMVQNASGLNKLIKWIGTGSGFSAIVLGSVIGIWYSAHIFKKLIPANGQEKVSLFQGLCYGVFVLLAFLIICSVIIGSINNSCEVVFGDN